MENNSPPDWPTLPDPFWVGGWCVHVTAHRLSRDGASIKLEPRSMDVLVYLAERAGETVSRERLEQDVWRGVVVGYDALNNTITKLRKALNDDPHHPQIIETIPKVGYRLIAKVTASPAATDQPAGVEELPLATPESTSRKQRRSVRSVLRAAMTLVAVVTVVSVVAWFMPWGGTEPGLSDKAFPVSDKPSIAVLPFDNLSGDPNQEYFSDGMTDDLITELSKVSGLLVIARNSSFAFKKKSTDIRDIARHLRVRYVLDGSVRKTEGRIRINAQLVDATTGTHLWAERYDEPLADVFALQDKVTRRIVAALKVELTSQEQFVAAGRDTDSVAAFDAFLKGWAHLSRRTSEDAVTAIHFFQQAVELDPNYSAAYAALAQTYWDYSNDKKFNTVVDPSMGASFAPSGFTTYLNAWKFLQKARSRPSSRTHALAARMLQRQRRFNEAMDEAKQAVTLGPNNPTAYDVLIENLIYAGKAEEALSLIDESIRLDPNLPAEKLFLKGMAYYTLGRLEEAVSIIDKARSHNPTETRYAMIQAAAFAELGRTNEATVALEQAERYGGITDGMANADLNWAMFYWPFQHLEIIERLAHGFIKAGLPVPPRRYYLATKRDRLTTDKIESVLSNRTMIGANRGYFGNVDRGSVGVVDTEFEITRDQKTQVIHQGELNYFRRGGRTQVKNDLLCDDWLDFLGEYCVAIYRNPLGSRDAKDEYLFFTLMSTFSFSVFEPAG